MSETDAALIAQARKGDQQAFEELVRRTSRLVYARLLLETGKKDEAEVLVQETYLLASRSLHRLRDANGFRAWLLSIAHNVLIDSFRKETRRRRTTSLDRDSLTQVQSNGLSPPAHAEREELRQRVLSVLRSLPEEYRSPLSLRYLAGADYETIGEQLGLTNGSLRGVLHRGLKMLRDRLPPELASGINE
jgi:RNA polymerase sigma-70 factor (ECF subfamily)